MDISKYKLKWIMSESENNIDYIHFKNYIKYMSKELNIYKEEYSTILYKDFVDIYDKLEDKYKTYITDTYYNLLNNEYNTNNRFNYILLHHTRLLIQNKN